MKTSLTLISAGLMVGLFATGAHAATLCSAYVSPATHPGGIAVTDMTFIGAGSVAPGNADDCYGIVQANDSGSNVWADTGWTLFAKDDTPGGETGGTINGISFVLDATPEGGATSGFWTLSWTETGTPGYDLTMDVVGVLKSADRFASYLFEDLTFTADASGTGTFKVSYVNNGSQIPDLSHLSLYYKNAVNSTSSGETSSTTSGDTGVPEPGVLGLLGIGLLGQALLLRQRRRRLQK